MACVKAVWALLGMVEQCNIEVNLRHAPGGVNGRGRSVNKGFYKFK